jgi:hypothetical protein
MQSWSSRMVEELGALRATGVGFDQAWEVALARHRPARRDSGPDRPNLFDEEVSLVEFTRQACSDAWHGRRADLRHLGHALDAFGSVDDHRVVTVRIGARGGLMTRAA